MLAPFSCIKSIRRRLIPFVILRLCFPHIERRECLLAACQEAVESLVSVPVCVSVFRMPKSWRAAWWDTPDTTLPNIEKHEVNIQHTYRPWDLLWGWSHLLNGMSCVCGGRGWCWQARLHPILGLDHLGLLTGCSAIPEACWREKERGRSEENNPRRFLSAAALFISFNRLPGGECLPWVPEWYLNFN